MEDMEDMIDVYTLKDERNHIGTCEGAVPFRDGGAKNEI